MTREEAVKRLKELRSDLAENYESAHEEADEILTELLRSIGYHDVADAFENVGKWYS